MIILSTSIILMVIGKVMLDTSNGEMNKLVGYRTKKSMMNQHNWDVGQKYSSHYMYKIFVLILPFSVPFLIIDGLSLFGLFTDFWFITSLIIQSIIIVLGLVLIFYFTEKKITLSNE